MQKLTRSAYHLHEKTGYSGLNSSGMVHYGEKYSRKIPSEVLPFSRWERNFRKDHLSIYLVPGSLRQHFRGYLETLYQMARLNPNHILGVE